MKTKNIYIHICYLNSFDKILLKKFGLKKRSKKEINLKDYK